MPDGSYSIAALQNYFEYIINKHETITNVSPVLIYVNEINNRIVFKIKSGYKLELLLKEMMELLGSSSDTIDGDKSSELLPKLESVDLVLVHCNVVNNSYQQASKVLFTFVPNKKYGQLITVSPETLIMLKVKYNYFTYLLLGLLIIPTYFRLGIILDLLIKMEFNKINNLLKTEHNEVPRFITKKWIEVQSQSGNTYNTRKPVRFKTSMLRSGLCDYSDAYVWVKGKITVTNPNDNANFDRRLTLKNNAPFISCISKINGELVENAEDLDIAMSMYNLLEYS